MKILICNIAIRERPDPFPPVACTSLVHILNEHGYPSVFYDIDAKRPSDEDMYDYFRNERFGLVGISAVVSTGYLYTKRLAALIKKASPSTNIILGGNLASAYEVILRKCDIDLCIIGEGEKVLLNLVRLAEVHGKLPKDADVLSAVKGVAFLDGAGVCRFTGPEELIAGGDIEEPDYELLDKSTRLSQYIQDPLTRDDFACDPRAHEPKRSGKKMATIFTSKGCINACTFCHRFVRGYRVIPLDKVIGAMKHLINKYNVGFFCISDECFGEDKVWLERFIELVKPLDILFQIGGARVSLIKKDQTIMRRLKDAGLTAVYFGIESGSSKILRIMEKNATKQENLAAIKLCSESGIYTVIQLVIGMPGENNSTIRETIEFINDATGGSSMPQFPAINYLQALPGTACYDYLREQGLLGSTIDDEERYLIRVSDVNASEFRQYVNVSEEPLAEVKMWKARISLQAMIHWLKLHGWKFPDSYCRDNGFRSFLKRNILIYRLIDLWGETFWQAILIMNRFQIYGIVKALSVSMGFSREDRTGFRFGAETLRERMKIKSGGF
ncbi:MAG: radical SAM protein [Candidatus Omnitrophota bacterium]